MKKTVGFLFIVMLGMADSAQAQSTRTWVSGVGDDVNPCSRTAPCKTFAGAISKTADGGYISALDPAGFGAVTITKSITIDGGAGQIGGILATGGTTGVLVTAGQDDVVILRNLDIEGAGTGAHGIRITGAAPVHVENVNIVNFTMNGIVSTNGSGRLFVQNTRISSIPAGQGIYIQGGKASLDNISVNGASIGVLSGPSAVTTVRHSTVSGGEMGYVAAYSANAEINLEDCVSAGNQYGVLVNTGAKARVSNSSIFNSSVIGLWNDGASSIITFLNNRMAGNLADGAFTSSIAVK
jgi:hypothetical protein